MRTNLMPAAVDQRGVDERRLRGAFGTIAGGDLVGDLSNELDLREEEATGEELPQDDAVAVGVDLGRMSKKLAEEGQGEGQSVKRERGVGIRIMTDNEKEEDEDEGKRTGRG